MTTIELPKVRRKEGAEPTTHGAPEMLEFEYDGDIYTVAVTHKMPAAPVLEYRAKISGLQKESGLLDDLDLVERVQEMSKRVEGMTNEQAKEVLTKDERQELFAFNTRGGAIETENAPLLLPYRAAIVCALIKAWNFIEALPTVELFENDSQLSEALIPVVWAWHFPTSAVSEAEAAAETTPNQKAGKSRSTTPAKDS